MNLNQWAIKWAVPYEALEDLRRQMGAVDDPMLTPTPGQSEAAVQVAVRMEAAAKGARLMRNNSGAMYDKQGRFVRFGLANESEKMNKKIKSSDLIGITPVVVTPQHVGTTLGVFTAREIKRGDWVYSGTPAEEAQLRFMELVVSLGGDACFANSEGTL